MTERIVRATFGMVLAGLLAGCPTSNDDDLTTGEYLLELEYRYHFFGPRDVNIHHGVYINKDGEAWYYDVSGSGVSFRDGGDNSNGDEIAANDLEEKFSYGAVLLQDIGPSAVEPLKTKIFRASFGRFVPGDEEFERCQYRAWLYDEDKDTYRLVFLYQGGGTPGFNESPDARELAEWLADAAGGATLCDPPGFG